MLFFCSFRYDWYGYDSYVPSQEKIASASVVFPASTCARIPTVTFFVPNFRFLSVRFCDALISPLLKKAPHMRGSFSHPYAM